MEAPYTIIVWACISDYRAAEPRRLHGRLLRAGRERLEPQGQALGDARGAQLRPRDQLDKAALQRLVASINRVIDTEAADAVSNSRKTALSRDRHRGGVPNLASC